ncbi:Hint domain-containing protein [Mycoplana ramosa]
MTSGNEKPSQLNRARRHFLGAVGAAGAKIAAVGLLASALLPASKARAWGVNWGKRPHGGSRCFLRGTAILTTKGEIRVEELCVGDLVETVGGKAMAIRWVGRQVYTRAGFAWTDDVMPIRIARHALGEGAPHTDLYVSPYHALYVDGLLIRAKDLVNGASIAPAVPPGCETIEYFHILLDSHEVVLAEGAAAETFLPAAGNHEGFANFAEFERAVPAAARAMASFAPTAHNRGRDHVKALLLLVTRPFAPPHDPIMEAQTRLSARARELAG